MAYDLRTLCADLLQKPVGAGFAYALTPATHPRFMQGVQEIAGKVQLPVPPKMIILRTQQPGALSFAHRNSICITNGFLTFAGQETLHAPPSKKMEMVLAHEMSHLKDGPAHTLTRKLLPWMALPLASVAAVYLYDKMRSYPEDSDPKRQSAALEAATQEELQALQAQYSASGRPPDEAAAWQQEMWQTGKYLVAATLGLGAGLMVSRHLARSAEFRADRMAIAIGRDPHAYITCLDETLREAQKTSYAAAKNPATANFAEKLNHFLTARLEAIHQHFLGAHPTNFERREAAFRFETQLRQADRATGPTLAG